ncbi:MAG: SapC family protein [Pseudomonadota bacterium]
MNDQKPNTQQSGATPITGSMFLYQQPELLTEKDHGHLGLTPPQKPFEHVRNERVVPLTLTEFGSAQRHFPIIFSSTDSKAVPLAVVGISESENLFVDETGEWDPMVYIPSYLRCYPFAFARVAEDRMAAVIDRAAASVSENPQFPFFQGGKPTEHTDQMMQFCTQYEAERNRTREFCETLGELGLLTAQQATHKQPGSDEAAPLAEYNSIDARKLTDLTDDKITEFHRNGTLSAMYLQLYSIENWRHLMARRVRREMRTSNGSA